MVGSLVPLIPEDLCEKLERETGRDRERERQGKMINGQLNTDNETLVLF